MRIKAAIGRNTRSLSLNNIAMITPSSQHSTSMRLATSIGVTYLNGIVNNNYANVASSVSLDNKFNNRLSDLMTSFDTIASRLPSTIARAVNSNKVYFSTLSSKSGVYGVPSEVISKLTLAYGAAEDRFSYYITGAIAAVASRIAIDGVDDISGFSVKAIMDSIQNAINVIDVSGLSGQESSNIEKRIRVMLTSHISSIRGIITSVLEDYVAGSVVSADSNDLDGVPTTNLALSDALATIESQVWLYFALMVKKARFEAKKIKPQTVVDILASLPAGSITLVQGSDDEVSYVYNLSSVESGFMYDENDLTNAVLKHDYDPEDIENEIKTKDYKSQGFASVAEYISSVSSANNEDNANKIFESMGIKRESMNKTISQLYDIADILSSSNDVKSIIHEGLLDMVSATNSAINDYLDMLTSLLGADENGSRLVLNTFLKSATWLDSLGSVFYKHATLGINHKASDLATKFNALTMSKDGVAGDFKVGGIDLSVSKDALMHSNATNGSSSRVYIKEFQNPFDARYFNGSFNGSSDKANEGIKPIISTSPDASSNYLFNIIDVICKSISGTANFLNRGDLSQFDESTREIANELVKYEIINYLSDGMRMKSVARNASLTLGADYTISTDSRKAIIDRLGIIDASLCASIEVINTAIMKANAVRISSGLDVLKGFLDINSQREKIQGMTAYYIPGDEKIDTTLLDLITRLNTITTDVFGVSISTDIPTGSKEFALSITVPAGCDVSANDMIRTYSDLFGSYESDKKIKDSKRKLLSTYDRFSIIKKDKDANIKMGSSAFATLWGKAEKGLNSSLSFETSQNSFASIVASSILLGKLKNGSVSSYVTRGPEEARMTGILPLSFIKDKTPRKLLEAGIDVDLRLVSNMFKFVNYNMSNGVSDKERAVGNILSLVTVGSDIQRFKASGYDLSALTAVDNVLNGSEAFSVVQPLDSIVRLGSISSVNFNKIDLRTYYGSSGDDLLFNILDDLGIYPQAELSYSAAQVLLIYNQSRVSDYKYPFINRIDSSFLKPGEKYTYTDLLDVRTDAIRSEDGKLTNHFSCSIFIWTSDYLDDSSQMEILDIGEKKPVVIADMNIIDLSQIDNNVELCLESSVDLPFGQRIVPGVGEQMLLSLANRLETII